MEFFRDTKIDFLGLKFWCIGVSSILVVGALLSMATKGFAFGIDFRGGADVQLKFREAPDQGALRASLTDAGPHEQSQDLREQLAVQNNNRV